MSTSPLRRNANVTLAELVPDVKPGFAVGDRDSGGVIQVRMNNVDLEGNLDLDGVIRVPATSKQVADCSLKPGDVLFNNTNSTELVGKSALFRGYSEPVTFSNHFTRLRVNQQRIEPRYLARWLSRQQRMRVFEGLCTRWVGQSAVRTEKLLALEIPLPPLSEQKRIADILDKANAIRRKRREAFQLVKVLPHALFSEMFDKGIKASHSKSAPSGWSSVTVDDVKSQAEYSCIGGPFGSDLTASDYVSQPGVPVIRGGNLSHDEPFMQESDFVYVSEEKADELYRCSAFRGDVIISQRGARLAGQVGLIHQQSPFSRLIVSQSQMKLTPDPKKAEPIFLVHYFQSRWAIREMENRTISTGVPHINLAILKSFPVHLPPLTLQKTFVTAWAKQQSLLTSTNDALNAGESMFDSLVQRAFRGEL